MEVVPRNSIERIYSIAVILLALVMFSSFVSSITSSMTHLRTLREKQSQQQENVRRYISENKLSMELGNRVHAFIRQHHRMAKTRVHECDIVAFRFIPEHLRFQMRCEIFTPTLTRHPLFTHMNTNDNPGLARICHQATSDSTLLVGEELFNLGQVATQMFFLTSGQLEYQHHASEGQHVRIEPFARICEVVLWAPWEHQGRLLALQTSELVTLDSAKFRHIARRRGLTSSRCGDYGAEYVIRLSQTWDGNSELMSDIWDDAECIQELAERAFGDGLRSRRLQPKRRHSDMQTDFSDVFQNAGLKLRAALQN